MSRKSVVLEDQEFVSMFDDESIAFDEDDLPYLKEDEEEESDIDHDPDQDFWDEEVESLEDLRGDEYYEPEFEY